MFRYNAYFGVHTVYYLDLVRHTGRQPLPMNAIILASLKTMLARALPGGKGAAPVLNPWTRGFLNKIDNLKFLAYVGSDGFPVILPAIQTQVLDAEHLVFSNFGLHAGAPEHPARHRSGRLRPGTDHGGCPGTRGTFLGFRRRHGVQVGVLKVDWVYNPMPPVPGQVYPALPLTAVRDF